MVSQNGRPDGWAEPSAQVGVFVVDDHDVVREGLCSILDADSDITVVGGAATAEEALRRMPALDPDVVIVDYGLPGLTGLDLCREIAERRLRAEVVMLSGMSDDAIVRSAFLSGARAYVVKNADAATIKAAVFSAARHRTTIDPRFSARVLQFTRRRADASPDLLQTHLVVLKLMVDGMSNAEIADAAQLTLHTVKSCVREIYDRLGAAGRSEAVALALRRGLL